MYYLSEDMPRELRTHRERLEGILNVQDCSRDEHSANAWRCRLKEVQAKLETISETNMSQLDVEYI